MTKVQLAQLAADIHILDGLKLNKEQFQFFKEPKEHFLPLTVL